MMLVLCTAVVFPRIFAQSSARQSAAFPSLEADPLAGELAGLARNNARNWQALLDLALWASGAGQSARNQRGVSYRAAIVAAAEELCASPELPQDKRARGEYVLGFTHRKFLKGYAETQTRLDEIVNTGRYNCVSSAVLYAILATAVDLDVQGVMTRDHAFA
ncbi:MAG: hypothetical protein LBH15_06060, partial [Treponema sp.]|nr:hypothetical protein [Treponema sp.]